MKTTTLTSIVVSGICVAASAEQLSYTIGELPYSWDDTQQPNALGGLTDRGAVAGTVVNRDGWIVSLWTTVAQELATVSEGTGYYFDVRGINRRGQVVGTFIGDRNHALLWSGGTTQDLGTLGGSHAEAFGINDHGDIVGASTLAGDNTFHPFLYRKGTMIDLGTFDGRDAFAFAINNKRQVVLELQDESANRLAIYEHGHLRTVGSLGGWTTGLAINEAGHVAGICQGEVEPSNQGHAFYYDGRRLLDLHVTGELFSISKSINNRDEVVGTWNTESASGGFMYRAGQRTNLSALLPPGSGWSILTAEHINDSGQIVGIGMSGGVSKFYRLTPVDPTEPPRAFRHAAVASGSWAQD